MAYVHKRIAYGALWICSHDMNYQQLVHGMFELFCSLMHVIYLLLLGIT